jgi:histidinol dehydrogenase
MIRRLVAPPLEALRAFLPQPHLTDSATRDRVATILHAVATRGDAAVRQFTLELDGVDLPPASWEIPRSDWIAARDRISPMLRVALERAVDRVRAYHEYQRDVGFEILAPDGTLLGMRVAPLDSAGLYVPGGKASYPSSVIMNAVPAVVAGVRDIVAVTPPGGFLTDAVLAACELAGVTRIFRVGGAHAVAALAYGTQTIPRVDKVVGPGNRWVAEAKRQLVGVVGIDAIAGPTELMVIADESADAGRVALDLIAQAEHDEDASAWCVTTSAELADAIPGALESALSQAPRAAIARASLERNGAIVVVPSLADAAAVANLRAPEHLAILTRDPGAVAAQVRHAGAIFLGSSSPEPVGDYIAGPSHVLPTGGTARYASPLGVYDFLKRTSIIQYSAARLAEDAPYVIALAEAEQLAGHAEAVRKAAGAAGAARAAGKDHG